MNGDATIPFMISFVAWQMLFFIANLDKYLESIDMRRLVDIMCLRIQVSNAPSNTI